MTFLISAWMLSAGAPDIPLPPVDVPAPPWAAVPSREPYAAVSVVELDEARSEVTSTAEHLQSVPGAQIQGAGGLGQRVTVSLRGASADAVLVLLDGVPLAPLGIAFDVSRVAPAALKEVQVLRGTGGRYGLGAMGGVVNFQTREVGLAPSVDGRVSYGSFTTVAADVAATTPLGPGGGLVALNVLKTQGNFDFDFYPTPQLPVPPVRSIRLNNDALGGNALLKYAWTARATRAQVTFFGEALERGLAGTAQNPQSSERERTLQGTLAGRTSTATSTHGRLDATVYVRVEDMALTQAPFVRDGHYDALTASVGAEARYRHVLGRHDLEGFLFGGGEWLVETPGVRPSQGRFAAMASDDITWQRGKLVTGASVRVDVAGSIAVVSPEVGASFRLPLGFSLRASGGMASRPPSFYELFVRQGTTLPNAALQPERGVGGELGVAWERPGYALSATGFGTSYTQLISWEYYAPSTSRPFNFDSALVAGVEAQATIAPARFVKLSLAYAWTHAVSLARDPRYYLMRLPFRPEHQGTAALQVGVPLVSIGVRATLQTAQFTNRTATVALAGRAFLDARVTSRVLRNPDLTVGFEMKNILDVQAQDYDGYPRPPRAGYLTLTLAWNGDSS